MSTLEHPDLPEEQEYIDRAYACLEEMREDATGFREAAGDTKARNALHHMSVRVAASLAEAEDAICAGRIDLESSEALYIGRRGIRDSSGTPIVINWTAPAARPFHEATPDDPRGLDRRRRFQLNSRTLVGISDDLFSARFREVAPVFIDVLLEELERERGSEMRDIVATIQAAQYRVITQPLLGTMVVQGGPGTGKTAVALHRAAWLISAFREELQQRGVLVIGPNPTFMRYIGRVLPSISDDAVDQASITTLVPTARARGRDDSAVVRLKGDARMAAVIKATIERRIRPPAATFTLTLDGYRFSLTGAQISGITDKVKARGLPYMEGRNQFRTAILRAFYDEYREATAASRRIRGTRDLKAPEDFESNLRRSSALQRFLDRSWPSMSSREVLHDLLEGPRILADAAADILRPQEQTLLLRRPVDRLDDVRSTESDLPLLDEAEAILQGTLERWGHVIVDEAQDLTPMELRMVSRRALRGSMTLAGDIAQATGPCPYDRWEEVTDHLVDVADFRVEELTQGYRVAGQAMAFAAKLLPEIAPGAAAPIAYRSGAGDPEVTRVPADQLFTELANLVTAIGGGAGTLGVIVPEGELRQVSAVLDGAGIEFWRGGQRAEPPDRSADPARRQGTGVR